ncbi:cysteine-rich receptor-like protein kinase [Trifolium pratense]|uniref:Cysteine-rich receptor-like protein kinase n=1 Tax=Trifolium pratense TaxID=57577 RepID=A0A2K3NEU3_TRIPR|nr:cysteine-rich receptor-like protein kinase [Trifolium pratense]
MLSLKDRLAVLDQKGEEEEDLSGDELAELHGRRRGNAISMIQAGGATLEGVTPIRQAVLEHFASHFKTLNMERPGWIILFLKGFLGDVMRFITDFHRNGKLTKGINSTFIALIPKVDSPQRLNDFRPISLVGSLYKILANVLANRLIVLNG